MRQNICANSHGIAGASLPTNLCHSAFSICMMLPQAPYMSSLAHPTVWDNADERARRDLEALWQVILARSRMRRQQIA